MSGRHVAAGFHSPLPSKVQSPGRSLVLSDHLKVLFSRTTQIKKEKSDGILLYVAVTLP